MMIDAKKKKYTGYVVEVKCNQSVWRVIRRYNDFFELDKVCFFILLNAFLVVVIFLGGGTRSLFHNPYF